MDLAPSQPTASVILTGEGASAGLQSLRKSLSRHARASGYSLEVLDAVPEPGLAREVSLARTVGNARGRVLVFLEARPDCAPETLLALIEALDDDACDLAIGAGTAGPGDTGPAKIPRWLESGLARLILWSVAETRDPWSGCYALRRDRLPLLGPWADRFPADLASLLLAAGSDLRIVDVSTRCGCAAPPASLGGVVERLGSVRAPRAAIEPARARSRVADTLGPTIDLAVTLALVWLGWTQGAANILGLAVGALAYLISGRLWKPVGSAKSGTALVSAAWLARGLVVVALALGLRGGAVATGLALGLPGWMAVAGGVAVAWLALAAGRLFRWPGAGQGRPTLAVRWSLTALGILVAAPLLHVFYLGVLPLMPEEGYYWNYAIRPALGYLDHPPMVAWLIGLSESFLGHGEASLRIPALACGALVIFYIYRFARNLVDRPAALVAAALAAAIPYLFLATGMMTTPDAPLAAAWAASLYFLHRALVGGEGRAWYGAGIALGLGLLSKYTIATLGLGAVAFCLIDSRARRWLLRPEPYVAVLIALLLFAPVIYWNWANDWVSFKFQSGGRFGEETRFSLHNMLGNMLLVATPLPLLVLPLLFVDQWTGREDRTSDPPHADGRNRLFVGCVVLIPLAVFAWSALRHLPRLNWTGPIWIATLPLLGWAAVHASSLGNLVLGRVLRLSAGPVIGGLLVLYSVFSYYAVLGLPGVPYPQTFARAVGWPEATRELRAVQDRIIRETGAAPVVVGMDKYNITSQVSFYGVGEDGSTEPPLKATTIWALSGSRLMFTYWDPPEQFRGKTIIMVARRRAKLEADRLQSLFGRLDPEIHPLSLSASGPGANGRRVEDYQYRIGYDFKPQEGGSDSPQGDDD